VKALGLEGLAFYKRERREGTVVRSIRKGLETLLDWAWE